MTTWHSVTAIGRVTAAFVLGLFLWAGSAQAQDCEATEYQRIQGPPNSAFGGTLAISAAAGGDVALVGAHREEVEKSDEILTDAGAAYFLRYVGGTWVEEQRVESPPPKGPTANSYFGRAVAVRGDLAIITEMNEHQSDRGAAYGYHFDRDTETWVVEDPPLTPEELPDGSMFGISAAIDETGTVAVIGAFKENGDVNGAAYVYRRVGQEWRLEQRLTGDGGWFGYDVGISGDTLVVMASYPPPGNPGAHVYRYSGDTWEPEGNKLVPAGAILSAGKCAISGDMILLGGPLVDGNAGAAFVFCRGGGNWSERYKISAPSGGLFGIAVALDQNVALIGANRVGGDVGEAYAYVLSCGGYGNRANLLPFEGSNLYGAAVALNHGWGVVGEEITGDERGDDAYFYNPISDCNYNDRVDICEDDPCPPVPVTVLPETVEVTRGVAVEGGLEDLFDSDNRYIAVEARRATEIAAPSVEIEVGGTSPVEQAVEISFTLEAACSGAPAIQSVKFFNFRDGVWEVMDERDAPPLDEVLTIDVTDDPDRFIEPGTGSVLCRIGYLDFGVTFPSWRGRYDQVLWTVSP
jgi:hypothetical protein